MEVDLRLHPARDSALGRLEGVAVADRLESFIVREQFQDLRQELGLQPLVHEVEQRSLVLTEMSGVGGVFRLLVRLSLARLFLGCAPSW